jgi:cytochrome c oxidase subunit 2
MVEKVANINAIEIKSITLVADGKAALDPYSFDYLLCNKICGVSIIICKIIVDNQKIIKFG